MHVGTGVDGCGSLYPSGPRLYLVVSFVVVQLYLVYVSPQKGVPSHAAHTGVANPTNAYPLTFPHRYAPPRNAHSWPSQGLIRQSRCAWESYAVGGHLTPLENAWFMMLCRVVSRFLVVSRCISRFRVQSAVGRRARRVMSRSMFRQAASCLPVAFIHAHPSMQVLPCHRCISLYLVVSFLPLYLVVSRCLIVSRCISLSHCAAVTRYISIYRCISFSRCVSLHLALSCSARTGALGLSAHHGHITGSITGVARMAQYPRLVGTQTQTLTPPRCGAWGYSPDAVPESLW